MQYRPSRRPRKSAASLARALRFSAPVACSRTGPCSSAGDAIADAIGLSFTNLPTTYQTAHVTEYLANSGDVVLNRISLNAGDLVTASVNTTPYGGGLNSYLRIFQEIGGGRVRPIASNDNYQGHDPGLTFQAARPGIYYVGISSFDNTAYDPAIADSGSGSSHGLFDLSLSKTHGGAARPGGGFLPGVAGPGRVGRHGHRRLHHRKPRRRGRRARLRVAVGVRGQPL